MSLRVAVTGLAIAIASFAAPASAQNATFTEIRDAIPLRYFSAATAVEPGPNALETTLVIGFETGANSFLASAQVNNLIGTRLAADTLSFTVNAPQGYYVSSLTCRLSGFGVVNTPGDARAAANWVVNGQPLDLGSKGGAPFTTGGAAWSLEQKFTSSNLTVVPVSLTTQLFAFAAATGASAEVELTRATIVVTVAPVAATGASRN